MPCIAPSNGSAGGIVQGFIWRIHMLKQKRLGPFGRVIGVVDKSKWTRMRQMCTPEHRRPINFGIRLFDSPHRPQPEDLFAFSMSSTRFFRPVSSIARSTALSYRRPLTQSRLFHTTPANMVVQEIKSQEEFQSLINDSDKPVLLDAFATWCGPCKAVAPLLEKWSDDEKLFKDKIIFAKFDVDNLPELSQDLGVRAMPTFFVFKDGKKVDEIVGANPPGIQKVLNSLV